MRLGHSRIGLLESTYAVNWEKNDYPWENQGCGLVRRGVGLTIPLNCGNYWPGL